MSDVRITYSINDKDYQDFLVLLKKTGKESGLTERQIEELSQSITKTGAAAQKSGAQAKAAFDTSGKSAGMFSGIVGKIGPLMAAAFAVDLVVDFTKSMIDLEKEVNGIQKTIARFSGQSGKDLDATTAKALALSETFGKDVNEVLLTVNAFSAQTGESFQDSLALIEAGFLNGADASGEFLDFLREYPVQFKNAGFSAEEFIKISTQQVRGGIYSDKLLDTVKELDLSLKELTKTQIDALKPLGEDFARNLERRLRSGQITTKEAFLQITAQAKTVGLNLQQTQTLVADVFKSAGEDAGGFAEVVKQVNAALDINLDQLDALGESQRRQAELQERYNSELVRLADNLDGASASAGNFFTQLKTAGVSALNAVIEKLGEAGLLGIKFFENKALKDLSGKDLPALNAELAKAEEALAKIARQQEAARKFPQLEALAEETGMLKNNADIQKDLNDALKERDFILKAIALKEKEIAETDRAAKEQEAAKAEKERLARTKQVTKENKGQAKALADQLALLRKQAEQAALQSELEAVGGEDSEGGIELIRKRELEKLRVQKAFALLSGFERNILEEKVNKEFDQRLLDLQKAREEKAKTDAEKAFEERRRKIAENADKEILEAERLFKRRLMQSKGNQKAQEDAEDAFNARRIEAIKTALREEIALREEAGKSTIDLQRQLNQIEIDEFRRKEEEKTQELERQARQREDVERALTDFALSSFDAVFQFRSQSLEKEAAQLQEQAAFEISLAGGNADKQKAIQDRLARQTAQIRKRQATAEKQAALFDIAVQTGINAVKLFALTVPPGILSAIAVAQGAVQAGLVASRPLPAFKDGVQLLKGPGTETSDSIIARLSKGEGVIKASINKHIYDFPHARLPEAVKEYKEKRKSGKSKETSRKIEMVMTADSKGFSSYVKDQNNKTIRKDNRYKIKG